MLIYRLMFYSLGSGQLLSPSPNLPPHPGGRKESTEGLWTRVWFSFTEQSWWVVNTKQLFTQGRTISRWINCILYPFLVSGISIRMRSFPFNQTHRNFKWALVSCYKLKQFSPFQCSTVTFKNISWFNNTNSKEIEILRLLTFSAKPLVFRVKTGDTHMAEVRTTCLYPWGTRKI